MITVFIQIDASKYPSEITEKQKSFPALSLLQKYDAVLDVLYSESGKAPTFDDINKVLFDTKKNVEWGEVMDILYTMIGDDYLYGHFTNQKQEQIFLLSFNGKYLQETGGNEKKIEREKAKEQLSKEQLEASINSVWWSKGNILVASALAIITLTFVISNWKINDKRESRESAKEKKEETSTLKQKPTELNLKIEPIEVSLSLKDSAKVKIKIEK